MEKYKYEIFGVLFCVVLGMMSGIFFKISDYSWYVGLAKSPLNPPNWVFGPVWSVLYTIIGIGLGRMSRHKNTHKIELVLFAIQFFANIMWTPVFFYMEKPSYAFYAILLMLFCTAGIIFKAHDPLVKMLMLPYMAWIVFASYLNYEIIRLN